MAAQYPFNDNMTVTQKYLPQRSGETPPDVGSFDVHPNSSEALRPDYESRNISNFVFALDAPFNNTILATEGTILWLVSGDGKQDALLRINIGDGGNLSGAAATRGIPVRNGFRISGIHFTKLYITNPVAQAGLVLELAVSRDWPDQRVDVML